MIAGAAVAALALATFSGGEGSRVVQLGNIFGLDESLASPIEGPAEAGFVRDPENVFVFQQPNHKCALHRNEGCERGEVFAAEGHGHGLGVKGKAGGDDTPARKVPGEFFSEQIIPDWQPTFRRNETASEASQDGGRLAQVLDGDSDPVHDRILDASGKILYAPEAGEKHVGPLNSWKRISGSNGRVSRLCGGDSGPLHLKTLPKEQNALDRRDDRQNASEVGDCDSGVCLAARIRRAEFRGTLIGGAYAVGMGALWLWFNRKEKGERNKDGGQW